MKKKGFTLIELLAVIVILAIIALIATPLVLKYIEKSRKESKVDSAYSFVRNLETEIANYSIKHNGKKYNKAPKNGKFYEFKDFDTDKDIDTTVKGDKPNNIKVCLSSLGQVEKAMFEYGKYYVSYDGRKGSISDKGTYDNFSCSGNGDDEDNSDYLFNEDTVNFSYDSEQGKYVGTYNFGDQEIPRFQYARYYELIIDNGEPIIIMYGYNEFYAEATSEQAVTIVDGVLSVYTTNELSGNKNVKIRYSEREYIPYMVRIRNTGKWYLHSTSFIPGNAKVKITDSEGFVYYEANDIEFVDRGVMVGTDGPNFEGIDDIPDVYTALSNGKIITITVTQIVDDKEVVTIIGGTAPKLLDNSAYYWGNPLFEESFT